MDGSDTIAVAGDGAPGSPFVPSAIIDPATGNKLSQSATGLLVARMPYCKVYATADQIRSTSEPLLFDTDSRDPFTMHSISGSGSPPANSLVTIPADKWYVLHTRIATEDASGITDVIARIRDFDRNIIGQSNSPRITTDGVSLEVYEEEWLEEGTQLLVTIDFAGVSSLTIQGGGSYGHRTNFTVRAVENA